MNITLTFSPQLIQLLMEIQSHGFRLCLVGGAPRDFLINGTHSKDLDFEVRVKVKENELVDWKLRFNELIHFLRIEKKLNVVELPYLIVKINFEDYTLEISSPRIEKFQLLNFTHHNFEATIDPLLSYEESFKRRDFTINAIGVELDITSHLLNENWIDPFNGKNDIKNNLLRAIDESFFKDSVRFLRLIRFSIKLSFSIEKSILDNLHEFNLVDLSKYHFTKEAFKTDFSKFLNTFNFFVKTYSLKVPNDYALFLNYFFPENEINSIEQVLSFLYFQDQANGQKVLRFFNLSPKMLLDLESFIQSLAYMKVFDSAEVSKILTLPIEEGLSNEIFKHAKNINDKQQWFNNTKFQSEDLTCWAFSPSDWANIVVLDHEIEKITPSLRSYYRYYKALKIKIGGMLARD